MGPRYRDLSRGCLGRVLKPRAQLLPLPSGVVSQMLAAAHEDVGERELLGCERGRRVCRPLSNY